MQTPAGYSTTANIHSMLIRGSPLKRGGSQVIASGGRGKLIARQEPLWAHTGLRCVASSLCTPAVDSRMLRRGDPTNGSPFKYNDLYPIEFALYRYK
jgi:hypothetical protein